MGPYLTTSERLGLLARLLLPYGFVAFLFLLNGISVPAPLSLIFKAPFFLMALYYWSVYRPSLVPPALVFSAGLLLDFITGVPLGANALSFLLSRLIVVDQRRFLVSQTFVVIWLGFAFLNFVVCLLQWLVMSLLSFQWTASPEMIYTLFFGIVLFPVVYMALHATHKLLPQ